MYRMYCSQYSASNHTVHAPSGQPVLVVMATTTVSGSATASYLRSVYVRILSGYVRVHVGVHKCIAVIQRESVFHIAVHD